ncbi:MAG: tRNA preQ1(34) S-adenosylmethionine ribosyltransferase-isomerase QueA [Magnetococcales bacterium]|nr:tRNA preQ1(34) S-adenosylmethionine ribosyltransferase-isomerase QueA [Magnetococcales bacterium]
MFDFELPEERIAQHPAQPRDAARLLISEQDGCRDGCFKDLPGLLRSGDLLVLNDTRVLPARLFGIKPTGGRVEVLLLRPLGDEEGRWQALLKSNRPVRMGDAITIAEGFSIVPELRDDRGVARVVLVCEGALKPEAAIVRYGKVPLPPYIASSGEEGLDRQRYQTVFAKEPGAVAAPTAGLHFTPELLDQLARMGVESARVTLHVGLGTFQPMRDEDPKQHVMHSEWRRLGPEAAAQINRTRRRGGRIIAVGTTAVRTLESAVGATGMVRPVEGETQLFIQPGFKFRVVDRIITNFHLPKTTLLWLVAGFIGWARLGRDYRHALDGGYRFYSYGDAMFLQPEERGSAKHLEMDQQG